MKKHQLPEKKPKNGEKKNTKTPQFLLQKYELSAYVSCQIKTGQLWSS